MSHEATLYRLRRAAALLRREPRVEGRLEVVELALRRLDRHVVLDGAVTGLEHLLPDAVVARELLRDAHGVAVQLLRQVRPQRRTCRQPKEPGMARRKRKRSWRCVRNKRERKNRESN